jgi:hypothetical protein
MQRMVVIVASLALCSNGMLISACAGCSKHRLKTSESPDRVYLAEAYAVDCGPAVPHNYGVSIARANDPSASHNVLTISNAFSKTVKITVDCPSDAKESCLPSSGREWRISKTTTWEGIEIRYAAGQRLLSLAPEPIIQRIMK